MTWYGVVWRGMTCRTELVERRVMVVAARRGRERGLGGGEALNGVGVEP
jgi:hypothetical protein